MLNQTIPNDPFTQELQRIRSLIAQGQLRPAAEALNQAQRKAPDDARVPLVGMRLADRAGNLAGAIQAARKALVLAPEWPVAMLELGHLLARNNERHEALRLAREALALEPGDAQVLNAATSIAYTVQDHEQALDWGQRGLALNPDNAPLRLTLGQALIELNRHADAQLHYARLLEQNPNDPNVLLGLMSCAQAAGDAPTAQSYADRALAAAPNDANVQYWHAYAHGRTPTTQPDAVVSRLFSGQAAGFDTHLVQNLQYHVPERMAQTLKQLHPDRRFNLLDLGCGTGLVGAHLGPIEGYIVGADLSERMIEEAHKLGIYAKFHQINLLDALTHTPPDLYEAITCADVLIYVGDATPVATGALRVLKPGGHFLASFEAARDDEPDLVLRTATGRYAHRASAIERILRDAGFADIQIEQLDALRMEGGVPLPGFLVTARKPAA